MKSKSIFRNLILVTASCLLCACGSSKQTLTRKADPTPKHEFRGTWIQTVGQTRYQKMNSAAMKHYIAEMVRKLDEAGINAVIFQIRPEADAFYKSDSGIYHRRMPQTRHGAPCLA